MALTSISPPDRALTVALIPVGLLALDSVTFTVAELTLIVPGAPVPGSMSALAVGKLDTEIEPPSLISKLLALRIISPPFPEPITALDRIPLLPRSLLPDISRRSALTVKFPAFPDVSVLVLICPPLIMFRF